MSIKDEILQITKNGSKDAHKNQTLCNYQSKKCIVLKWNGRNKVKWIFLSVWEIIRHTPTTEHPDLKLYIFASIVRNAMKSIDMEKVIFIFVNLYVITIFPCNFWIPQLLFFYWISFLSIRLCKFSCILIDTASHCILNPILQKRFISLGWEISIDFFFLSFVDVKMEFVNLK